MDKKDGMAGFDQDKIIKQAKERLERYINLEPDSSLYPQLNDRQRKGFANGTSEEREMLRIYEKQNPFLMNSISGTLGIAETLLSGKLEGSKTIGEIQRLMTELKSSGANEGKPVSKEQVLRVQELLRQTLETIS